MGGRTRMGSAWLPRLRWLWLAVAPWIGLGAGGHLVAQTPGPTGIWNLETRNLAERATGGVRNVLLRVQESGGGFTAQMTSPRNNFLDVQEFRYDDGDIVVQFGAYLYTLRLEGDELTGTMTSPVDTASVVGRRQQGTMYFGDQPAEYVATRTGLLGHRTELAPPEDEADPAEWVRSRVETVNDFALILRGIPVSFANPEAFESELRAYAGRRVSVLGAWIGETYRIDEIRLEEEGGR
jgi:hypothetical protein